MDMCFELAGRIVKALGAVTVVDETHGFRFFDNRDLLGFVDGTENPEGPLAVSATEIGDEDPDFAGGCYVHVQKYLHDMRSWESLSVTEQELVIGRTKLEDIEMDDDVKPANSHIALNVIEDEDGNELKIVRHNMPFGEIGKGEFGTYFIGYSRTAAVTERMLSNMFIGDPPGNTDHILEFSTAVTGGKFFTPIVDFLNDPPPLPDSAARRRATRSHRRARRHQRVAGDRQPERNPSMNNLYRDLAPITEAAWAEIEVEATRTFKRHIAGRRVVDVSEPGGPVTAAISTGHLLDVAPPGDGVVAHLREASRWCGCGCRSRCPRTAIDDVERGSQDSDWDPVKDAAKKLAFVEDRAIFEGYDAASIDGIRACSSNPALALPAGRPRDSRRHRPGAVGAAAGGRRRPVLGAAVGRRVHQGQRDHRTRLSDPRAPQPAGRRRDHLGARDRRRVRAVHPRRRLRSAAGHRRVDRLPVARRRHGRSCTCRRR